MDDYSDYPMGDERTYQNKKKFGSPISPNKNALRKGKVGTAKSVKRSTSDGYMPKTTLVTRTPIKSLSKERKYNVDSVNKPQVKSKQRTAQ